MAYRESDQLIILYTIEEGADRILSLQRITFARLLDWITNANLPAGNSKEGKIKLFVFLRKRVSLKSPVR